MSTLCCRDRITLTPGVVEESGSHYTAPHDRDGAVCAGETGTPDGLQTRGFTDQKSPVVVSEELGVVGLPMGQE